MMVARQLYDEQLRLLDEDIAEMGSQVSLAMKNTLDILAARDRDKAREQIERDDEIDESNRRIEALCINMLLRQQPVASDLRHITSALKMVTDLERVGDLAADICDTVRHVHFVEGLGDNPKIREMGNVCISMLNDAVNAFQTGDIDLARSVMSRDDVVDDLYASVCSEGINVIAERKDTAERALHHIVIARYLERVGDHATNIAEWAEYSVSGLYQGEELALGMG